MLKIKTLSTAEEVKAVSDPYRLRILQIFKSMQRPATVKQIADKMSEVPAKVHYHVKMLEKAGLLVLVHTKEINGIIAKFYEPTAESFKIKNTESDDITNQLLLTETTKLISSMYDESKRTLIETLDGKVKAGVKDEETIITKEHIYVTKEEAKELSNYITKFCENKLKKTDENRKEYQVFFSLINLD